MTLNRPPAASATLPPSVRAAGRCHVGLGGVYQRVGRDEEARGELTYAVAMRQAMRMRYWLQR